MSLARASCLKIAWYQKSKWATSNQMYQVLQFLAVPKVTSKVTCPSGIVAFLGTISQKGAFVSIRRSVLSRPMFHNVLANIMFTPRSSLMRTLVSWAPSTTGFSSRGSVQHWKRPLIAPRELNYNFGPSQVQWGCGFHNQHFSEGEFTLPFGD